MAEFMSFGGKSFIDSLNGAKETAEKAAAIISSCKSVELGD